jgi:hypothetical protein
MATIEKGTVVTEVDVVDQGTIGAELVTFPGYAYNGTLIGRGPEGGPAIFVENDPGVVTGTRYVRSFEVDEDYRIRVAHDHLLDKETFNYASQNTGKHSHNFTTITATVSANGLLLNSGAGVATATGMTFGTHAEFPAAHAAGTLYVETNVAVNFNISSIPSNTVADIGLFRRGASTAFAPTDGAYFRFTSAGISCIVNNNGVETAVAVGNPQNIQANENHKYAISVNEKEAEFWVDDVRYASVDAPLSNPQLFRSSTLPWSARIANTGAVTPSALQVTISDYAIHYGGPLLADTLASIGNRALGSHQGLSGGTMGTLAGNMGNVAAFPTAAAGSNTAALTTGLGGIGNINAAVSAAASDFILTSYQVPAGTTSVQGRRLVLTGVRISMVNLVAAVATTPTVILLGIAHGHTAVSLATTETASFATGTTKAPRREPLGFMSWALAAPAGAMPQNGDIVHTFANPIYINPGEFIATTAKFVVGTATATETFGFTVLFDYGWE